MIATGNVLLVAPLAYVAISIAPPRDVISDSPFTLRWVSSYLLNDPYVHDMCIWLTEVRNNALSTILLAEPHSPSRKTIRSWRDSPPLKIPRFLWGT